MAFDPADIVCMDGKTVLHTTEYEAILHALGLTPRGRGGRCGRRWAYRNYFAAGEADVAMWRRLEERGFALQICAPGSLRPFHTYEVTPEGIAAADLSGYVPKSMAEA